MRATVALLVILLGAGAALADDIAPAIQRGVALYDDLEYNKAVAALGEALADKALDKASKITGYKYLALSYVALRQNNDAQDAFRKLLEIDRNHQLDRAESQTARDLLAEVRESMPHEVSIRQTPSPSAPRAGSPLKVDIVITDPDGEHRAVVLYHRTQGATEYSAVQAAALGKGAYTATVSGAFVERPGLEYYVVTTSASGRPLASVGGRDKPLSIAVAKARAPAGGGSVLSSPWFWAGTGAVAVAGAAAAFFILRSDDPPQPGAQINIVVQFE